MKRQRFTADAISRILDDYHAGRPVGDICREHEISNATFYRWKAAREGRVPEAHPQSARLAEENRYLKRLLAEAMLDLEVLRKRCG